MALGMYFCLPILPINTITLALTPTRRIKQIEIAQNESLDYEIVFNMQDGINLKIMHSFSLFTIRNFFCY